MALTPMKVSALGRKELSADEGVRLKAYLDCVGIWTIGTGHTAAAGPPHPVAGMTITALENDQILARDLGAIETGIMKLLKRQPTQAQFDAMVRITFNIGLDAFKNSSILSEFNRGNTIKAAAAFLLYNRAGGRVLSSLTARRRRERDMFLSGSPKVEPEGPTFGAENMPSKVDVPEPPKTMAESKTGWASIVTGAGGVTGVVAAAQPAIQGAQSVKDAAGQAKDLIGIDGKLALLIGLAIVIIVGSAFIWFDRRKKLIQDGV